MPVPSAPVERRSLTRVRSDRDVEYRHSPHLAQWALHNRLDRLVEDTVLELSARGLPRRVLEVGAGHGGQTQTLLAAGCDVTMVEMSRVAFEHAHSRYPGDERVTVEWDRELTLSGIGAEFSLVLCVSVLHHIPDYLDALYRLEQKLLPGGAILTVQDPLWYPRVGRLTSMVDRGAYLVWRLGQGQVRQGLAAMLRRMRGQYPEQAGGDEVVYHHVVRSGVDEVAIGDLLRPSFERIQVLSYWSNHLSAARRPAQLARLENTFAMRATGYLGPR